MTTRVVKQDGTGDYTNLTAAFAATSSAGDIIEIQDSETYNEGNLGVFPVREDITVRAAPGYTPVLDGGGTLDCAIKFWIGWVIEGLTITGYDGTTTDAAGFTSMSGFRTVTIRNCTLHNLADVAIHKLGTGSLVENCTIYNIHTGVSAKGIHGSVYAVTIKNCLLYDIIDDGIYATNASTVIEHCTLFNVGYGGNAYGILATLGTVKYCIISDKYHILSDAGLRATTHSYNCVSGSEDSDDGNFYGGAGTGDIQSDPLLITGTFKIPITSPCIAAAVGSTRTMDITSGSVTWRYSQKVNGVNVGATPNEMGAYEFQYTTVMGVDTNKVASVMNVS